MVFGIDGWLIVMISACLPCHSSNVCSVRNTMARDARVIGQINAFVGPG